MSDNANKPESADRPRSVAEQRADMAPADKADVTGNNDVGDSPVDRNRLHKVVAGETLQQIADKFYGSAARWERVFAANRDQLSDPQMLTPGQMLIIPPDPGAGASQ